MASSIDQSYVAAVVGATGASGAALLDALARSDRISRVVAVARSSPPPNIASEKKVEWKQLSLDDLARRASAAAPSPSNPLRGVDAVFCALGTTRADAGSAQRFWNVDVSGAESVARLSRQQERRHRPRVLSLVSASGASRNSLFSKCTFPALLHPLYYSAAKGAAEQAFVASGIAHVFLYRPGLLDRGETKRRRGESLAIGCGFPSLKVRELARVMVADAIEALDGKQEGTGGEVVRGDSEIKRRAAAAVASSSSR